MSRFDELIAEFCPDGVEYRKLGDVANIRKGEQLNKDSLLVDGPYPVLNGGRDYSGYWTEPNSRSAVVAVSQGGASAGFVSWMAVPFWAGAHCYVVEETASCEARYLFHLLKSCEAKFMQSQYGAGIPSLSAKTLTGTEVPVPPIEVQREIVRILDTFAELTDELTEELDCRSQQYAYYRDEVIHNCSSIKWLPLSEISENCNRARKPIKKDQRIVGCTPYYGASGIVDYVDGFTHDGDYLLISEDGANLLARSTPIAFQISGRNWINNHAHVLRIDNAQLRLLIEIYLNSISLEPYISKGAQPKLTKQKLETIEVPVPSKSDLSRIADILGCFDALTTSLTDGLPAEIEARKAQYGYYRDRLLDFPRKEVAAS